jgi:preprotein translocase subunit YajC
MATELKLIEIIAQQPTPSAATKPVEPPWYTGPVVPLLVLGGLMIVFMSRSKKTEQNKREQMLAGMKKGDEVQTIGGEFGRVVEAREDRVLLKVDETSNTKIWYARNAIHRVVTGNDAKVEAK